MPSSVSCRRNEPPSRGLTLLELLVVLVVLAVCVTLALPNLSGWIEKYTVWKAARQLVTDLQLAKMRAVSHGLQHRVAFDAAHGSCIIEQGNASKGSTTWAPVGVVRDLSGPQNPHYARGVMLSTNFTDHVVIFSTRGTASPAGTVTLGTANQIRRVIVVLSGRIRSG